MTYNPHVFPGHDPESRWRLKAAMTYNPHVIPGSHSCVIPAPEPESRWRVEPAMTIERTAMTQKLVFLS